MDEAPKALSVWRESSARCEVESVSLGIEGLSTNP